MMLLYSKTGYRAIAGAVLATSKDILMKRFVQHGLSEQEATVRAQPIVTEIQTKTNPYYDYSIYVMPGLIMAILQMSAAFSTLWLFRRDIEHAGGRIIPHKGNRTAFLFGRLIPLFMANMITLLFAFIVLYPMANIPIPSCFVNLFGLSALFVATSMGMGALFSIFLKNIVTGVQMGLLVNAPAFVFSGYTYPKWAMPGFVIQIGNIEPLTHFLDGFFPMFIFGRPTMHGVLPLIIEGIVLWGLVVLLLYKPGDYMRALSAKLSKKG
jgi:ABC-2 type transport system permease protein